MILKIEMGRQTTTDAGTVRAFTEQCVEWIHHQHPHLILFDLVKQSKFEASLVLVGLLGGSMHSRVKQDSHLKHSHLIMQFSKGYAGQLQWLWAIWDSRRRRRYGITGQV